MQKTSIFSKDFLLVAAGQIISLFGNQILRYALPLYLLNRTGSSALFGTISACAFIPMLILFPVGGIIADRANKRNIMVSLDFGTAGLIFLFSVLSGTVGIVPLTAATMMILYGIQGAYQPAVKASVPVLVDSAHLMQANSIVDVISSAAGMAGPVIGGILYSLAGLKPILYISTGCFMASAAMELFIRIPYKKMPAEDNIFVTGICDLKESFCFMFKKQPVLWKMSFIYASINLLLNSLVLIGVPVLITQHLGFSPDTANRLYGYAQGVIAGGSILGGLLAGALSEKLKPRALPLVFTGCVLSVLAGGTALHLAGNPVTAYLILSAGCGLLLVLETLFTIQIMSYIQILTPGKLTGKVISCVMCICMCTNPLGQFIYGIVFETIGEYTYLPFYAAAIIMMGVVLATRSVFREVEAEIGIQYRASEGEASNVHPARI